MENRLIKIAIVGPESTGKSSIAQYLAQAYQTFCVPEYARYYCAKLNNQYTPKDELNMFYGQIALEDAIIHSTTKNILICDTTILTVKVWSDYLFQNTPAEVLAEINNRKYDLYLLMDIDLPWEHDPLRDFPNEREYFLEIWKNELVNLGAQYEIINGLDDNRFQKAKNACEKFLTK